MGHDMRANLLHVFTCYANPLRWWTRRENFHRFEHHILALGLPLTRVECSYGRRDWDLPERPGVKRVRVRARDVLWHKENLLGFAAQRTPDREYAATIDGDIYIVDPDWPICTLNALHCIRSCKSPVSWYSSALPGSTVARPAASCGSIRRHWLKIP
jgi:hypothetical protein